jgi:hypothetical protein
MTGWSDGHRELIEGFAGPVAGGDIRGEFVVAAVQILDERVPGDENTRGAAAFQACAVWGARVCPERKEGPM